MFFLCKFYCEPYSSSFEIRSLFSTVMTIRCNVQCKQTGTRFEIIFKEACYFRYVHWNTRKNLTWMGNILAVIGLYEFLHQTTQRCTHFLTFNFSPQNSRHLERDMKQIPQWGHINNRCHLTKFNCLGNPAPAFCALTANFTENCFTYQ